MTDWTQTSDRGGMSVRQGIRAGNDLWLHPYENIGGKDALNVANATDLKAARVACKNILYAVVDTEYTAEQYRGMADSDIYQTSGSIGFKEDVFAWWVILLVVLDVAAVAGIAFWIFITFKPKKVLAETDEQTAETVEDLQE